jgi:hypothetical protein
MKKIYQALITLMLMTGYAQAQTTSVTLSPSKTNAFYKRTLVQAEPHTVSYTTNPTDHVWYRNNGAGYDEKCFNRYQFAHPTIPNARITSIVFKFTSVRHQFNTFTTPYLRAVIPQDNCNNMTPPTNSDYAAVEQCLVDGANFINDYAINLTSATEYTRTFNSTSTPTLSTLLKNATNFTIALYVENYYTDVDLSNISAVVTYDVPPITSNTIGSNQSFTNGYGNPAVLTGTAPAGGTGSYLYQWQSSTDNSSWLNINGATAASYDPPVIMATTYYKRIVNSSPATALTSNVVTVSISGTIPAIGSNTIGSNQALIADSDPTILTGTVPTGGIGSYTYQWQISYDGTSWNSISATGASYDPPADRYNQYYRRVVFSAPVNPSISNVVSITYTFNPPVTSNTIASNQILNGTGDPAIITGSTPSGGSGSYIYSWEYNVPSDGTQWYTVGGATGINYDPSVLSKTTKYRRVVKSFGTYTNAFWSNEVTVSICPTTPFIEASTTKLCPTINSSGLSLARGQQIYPGLTFQWQTVTCSGVVSNIAGATAISYSATTQDQYRLSVGCAGNTYISGIFFLGQVATCNSIPLGCATQGGGGGGCIDCRTTGSTTGINSEDQYNIIHLYPNPNSGQFTITLTAEKEDESVVSIITILGKEMLKETHFFHAGENQLHMDMANYPKGIYFVQIQNKNEKTQLKMIYQ